MAAAHASSGQSWWRRIAIASLSLAACAAPKPPPSVWPPDDFVLVVDELRERDGVPTVVRRCRVRADGLVVYGTATGPAIGDRRGLELPVLGRLAIYRLERQCVRALARAIDRCRVLEIEAVAGEPGGAESGQARVVWRAFGRHRELQAFGRVHGALADILAIVGAHLPEGEAFELPGVAERGLPAVVRGAPRPREDLLPAFEALREQARRAPGDAGLQLDAFALACRLGLRGEAEQLLAAWSSATAAERAERALFPEGEPLLLPERLAALLPGG